MPFISIEELVHDSDLIVVGILNNVSEYSQYGIDYAQGTISVDEVIWGAAQPGEVLTLKWKNESGVVCPRVDHRLNQNRKAIWLLTTHDGEVHANYPGRFVDLAERSKVEQSLVKDKVRLRTTKDFCPPNEPLIVWLVFRNATQTPIAFPGVENNDGRLILSPDLVLTVRHSYGESLTVDKSIPGKVIFSKTLAPIIVQPQQEFTVAIDLKEFFLIANDKEYFANLRVKGFGRESDIFVYTKTEDSVRFLTRLPEAVAREPISRLRLLIPSALAIIVSSLFVFRHSKELVGALTKSRCPLLDRVRRIQILRQKPINLCSRLLRKLRIQSVKRMTAGSILIDLIFELLPCRL